MCFQLVDELTSAQAALTDQLRSHHQGTMFVFCEGLVFLLVSDTDQLSSHHEGLVFVFFSFSKKGHIRLIMTRAPLSDACDWSWFVTRARW